VPAFRIIPCLDVHAGRVVKGVNFVNLREMGDPVELAQRYRDEGADELVFLDISATVEERAALRQVVARVAVVLDIPFTVGGGVGSVEDAGALLLAGADKVAVNSAAVRAPELLTRLAERFGCQCVVLAVDARRVRKLAGGGRRDARAETGDGSRESEDETVAGERRGTGRPANRRLPCSWPEVSGPDGWVGPALSLEPVACSPGGRGWEVVTHGGRRPTGLDAIGWIAEGARRGAGEILLTSMDRDGTGRGYDLTLLAAARAAADLPLIASGGGETVEHFVQASAAGADAGLAATIFHEARVRIPELKAALAAAGIAVRQEVA
jgi:cyclase